ncbi:MAG: tRNA lysidine(34) synthetase TilS [Gammaproteobacteria bacterium]
MQDSPADISDSSPLRDVFHSALQSVEPGVPLCVAISGGRDSVVLLHLAATLSNRPVYAVHVNHGLHPEAADWADHCQRVAQRLRVPVTVLEVTVAENHPQGLEAAAREARYQALHDHLKSGEVLLTAHHEQDQLETYLLQLLRGSGVAGLSAMPQLQERDGIVHFRPLLNVAADDISNYAEEQGLEWIEDPSNADEKFDRNYLRHVVIPRIHDRWPAADRVVARAARLSAKAAHMLDELADIDLAGHFGQYWIDLAALLSLNADRQANAIRSRLRLWEFAVPSEAQLGQALQNLLHAADDRLPEGSWPGVRVRRFHDRLWFFQETSDPVASMEGAPQAYSWIPDSALEMGGVRGNLQAENVTSGGIALSWFEAPLQVRFRRGGESLRPGSEAATRKLKKLLQENDIFPWMRCHIPLVYRDEQLLAVGDLWTDAAAMAAEGEAGKRITWCNHAPICASSAL